ncbi:MAG: TIGR04211 family SH3 domain-containing protein [Nitrospirales bacterium]
MKLLICLVLLALPSLILPTQTLSAIGDVNYISDELKVPLRSGPSTAHRIIHRGLPSGTHLTILATDEEKIFTQVRTDGGTEGWIRTQYLVNEPIARTKLATAERRLQNLKTKINKERKAHTEIQSLYKEAKENNAILNSKTQSLNTELQELKRVSADPIREHTRNIELSQQNENLRNEVGKLSSTVKQLEDNVQREWLLYGGALVLIGLILGVTIKARPRKSTYSRYT